MARLVSAILLVSACAGGALADDSVSTKAVYDCAAVDDDAARLACYDEAVGRLKAAEEAGEITTVSREDVQTVQREAFGFSLPSLPSFGRSQAAEPADIERIAVAVTRVSETPLGKVRVTLENGQVWVQTDTSNVYYSKRKGVEEAEIKRAALGSFRMKLDGGTAFRVKRLQ